MQDSYRLVMVPGRARCGGGEGTSTFDMLGALEQWVTSGKAPAMIPASRRCHRSHAFVLLLSAGCAIRGIRRQKRCGELRVWSLAARVEAILRHEMSSSIGTRPGANNGT